MPMQRLPLEAFYIRLLASNSTLRLLHDAIPQDSEMSVNDQCEVGVTLSIYPVMDEE